MSQYPAIPDDPSVAPGSSALDRLTPEQYDALRALAARRLAETAPGATFEPTALVHEALARLITSRPGSEDWRDADHFIAATALAIRRILVDRARRHRLRRRCPVALAEPACGSRGASADAGGVGAGGHAGGVDVLALNDLLEKFGVLDPRAARIVELRYFAGLSVAQTANLLGLSRATVESDWRHARAWLAERLSP